MICPEGRPMIASDMTHEQEKLLGASWLRQISMPSRSTHEAFDWSSKSKKGHSLDV